MFVDCPCFGHRASPAQITQTVVQLQQVEGEILSQCRLGHDTENTSPGTDGHKWPAAVHELYSEKCEGFGEWVDKQNNHSVFS